MILPISRKFRLFRSRLGLASCFALALTFSAGCSGEDTIEGPDAAPQDTATEEDTAQTDTGTADSAGPDSTTDVGGDTEGDSGDSAAGDTGDPGDTQVVKEKCNGIDDDGDGKTDEDACDDGLPCTEDYCDKVQKFCTFSPIADGGECNDGNACTAKDVCTKGVCVGSTPTTCDDGDACTDDLCNPTLGACESVARAAGATCDDGDPCTAGDTCTDGKCTGKPKVCDDNNPCTIDACTLADGCTATGDEGKPCDDGDPCTKDDACGGDICSGKLPQDCVADSQCQLAACDPKDGSCSKANKPDGTGCTDDDLCTQGDTCQQGACKPAKVVECPPGKACLVNACDANSGLCLAKLATDGTACDDGNPCTIGEACVSGNCSFSGTTCDDNNACTTDACEPGVGCKHTSTDAPCDDGDLCTIGEACAGGKCAGAKPKGCDDGSACTVDSCDATTGNCVNDGAAAEGKPCDDDGSACTTGETCTQGKCLGGSAKVCKDDDPCTADGCDPVKGDCAFPPAKVGTSCNDGSFCTFGDACDDKGKCNGKGIDCNDQNPCTSDSCDPKTGACSFVAKAANDSCDDGDLCTKGDACDTKGACIAGKATDCNDGNLCTDDSCDQTNGKCVQAPNSKPCDDGSICTTGESCIEGSCKSGIDGDVSTVSGSGTAGFLDGNATTARFYYPRGVAVDAKSGQVAVADYSNQRIRLVAPDGAATLLAGSGTAGLLDGAATSARFNGPVGVEFDPLTGDVVVGDRNNHAIRRVSPTGQTTTFAGTTSTGFIDGKGTAARFYYPEGVDVDSTGVVYVADRYNHAIRRIETDGTVTTVAGQNSAGYVDAIGKAARFNYPSDVALDAKGVIFITDVSNQRIRAMLPDGTVSTVAGNASTGYVDGFGTAARFNSPETLDVSPAGYLLVGDRGNHRIRKVTKQGEVTTFSGSGAAGFVDGASAKAAFNYPWGLAIDGSGRAWIGDYNNHRIRRTALGTLVCTDDEVCTADACDAIKGCTHTAIAEGKPCEDGGSCSTGGACDAKGSCAGAKPKCADATQCAEAACDPVSGACKPSADGKQCNDGNPCTTGEACLAGGCVATVQTVTTVAGNGNATFVDGNGVAASIAYGRGCAVDAAGTLYFADANAHRIRRLAGGAVTSVVGDGTAGWVDGGNGRMNYPADVAVSPNGWLAIADRNNHRIRVFGVDGQLTTVAGSGSATFADGKGNAASFYYPEGVAVSVEGDILVADTYNNRIRRVALDGTVTTLAGSGSSGFTDGPLLSAALYRPGGLVEISKGVIVVADSYNHRIRILQNSAVQVLAGNGSATFVEGTGTGASFYYPAAVAKGPDGTILVADRSNSRIRSIDLKTGKTSTVVGSAGAGWQDGVASAAKINNPYGVAASGSKIWVMDSSNYRIRQVLGPEKDCDDGDACTTDSCDAKTGNCSHVKDPLCCSPIVDINRFDSESSATGMQFFTCEANKLEIEPKNCQASTGKAPTQGWQLSTDLTTAWSAPGALYYGELPAESYDFGASGGKVITAKVKVPTGAKKLTFRVYFDTEPQAVFDRLYAWLQVDGKRISVTSNDPPTYGAVWYKGSPGFEQTQTWHLVDIDVTPYIGKDVALEFTFNTGDGLKNFGKGVIIDDVTVTRSCTDK